MKQYEFSGGPVRRDRCIYVERNEDTRVYNRLKNDFDLVVITAPRQCGKTSLVKAIGDRLKGVGIKFVYIDFRAFSRPFTEAAQADYGQWWFQAIFKSAARQLGIEMETLSAWLDRQSQQKTSLKEQFTEFFREFLRGFTEETIVTTFDEIDIVGELGYYTENFFDAIQVLFNDRTPLKISFILVGIAHPSLLLKGHISSGFKVGVHYPLPDFEVNRGTIDEWVQGLKISDEKKRFDVGKEILIQTGGQPYLTALIMHEFNERNGQDIQDISPIIDDMVEKVFDPQLGLPHFKAPLNFIVERERYAYQVLEEYRKIMKAPQEIGTMNEKVRTVLSTTGLARVVDNRFLDVRCPIYRRVFDENWCKQVESGLGKRDWYSPLVIPSYLKKKKPTLCLFNTGGTIGMVEHNNKMVAPENALEFLSIYPSLRDIANIDFVQFPAKDGANMFPVDWTAIARSIYDRRNDGYDGFVIAHGTDTMAYTASAVAFALGAGLNIPVVFVGAQAPHNVPHGDALENLSRACMIASQEIPEVVICFGDEVYRAVRAEKYSDYHFKGFHSPTFAPLAVITEMIEIKKGNLWIDKTKRMECKNQFEDQVLQISQYPGYDPRWLEIILETRTIKGIIIESLGIGNLPTLPESKYNLLPVLEKAIKQFGIPVVITSKYPIKPEFVDKYIPATAPLLIGAISAGNMTSAAALTKLMWLLPQIERDIKNGDLKEQYKLEEIKTKMAQSFVGEVDPINIEEKKEDQ